MFTFRGTFKVRIFWEGQKICEISTLDLSYVVTVKSTVEISQNIVAFSEYENFTNLGLLGMYFDAAIVFVTKSSLLFRLAAHECMVAPSLDLFEFVSE